MTDQWYYRSEGETRGPLSRRQLDDLVQSARINQATLVWREGFPDWVPLGTIRLSDNTKSPPPPPPPICPPPPPRSAVRPRTAGRPPPDSLRWIIIAAAGCAAVLAAGAIGWLAHGITSSRQEGLTVIAEAPTARQPATKKKLTSDTTVANRPIGQVQSNGPARPAGAELPPANSNPPADNLPQVEPAAPTATEKAPPNPAPPEAAPKTESPPPSPPPVATQPEPSEKTQTLFQAIEVQRAPKYSILGAETVQDLQYQILSELRASEPDDQGARKVAQIVKEARLVKSDELSRSMYEKSLGELVGWQFSYQLNRHGEVVEFKSGPAEGRRSAAIEPKGGKGFLVTSVMDEAGWKELAQLSFFTPDPQASGNQPMIRQMTHDFGPLGRWSGTTRFERKGTQRGVLRIDYLHDMTYEPPDSDRGELPFAVKSATFKPEFAGGTIYFDTKAGRVQSAQDRFQVRGEIATEILGQAATVQVEEQQAITVRIFNQDPGKQARSAGDSTGKRRP